MKIKLKKLKQKIITFDYKKYCKNNILFLTFVITSVLNGLLIRIITVGKFLDIRPMIADTAMVTIVAAFGYLIKPQKRHIYYLTWSIIYTTICIINSMYYTNYLSYSSISLIATSFLIVDVKDAIVENILEPKDFLYLWQIIALILTHQKLKKTRYYETKEQSKRKFKQTLIISSLLIIAFGATLRPTDIGRITKQWNREYIVMRYGIYTYQFSDIFASLTPTLNSMFGYDKNAKIFREYYDNNKTTQETNEYTNKFKGKNVLVIHGESIQQFAMETNINGVELTPNINKLAKEGIYFSNFYAQESVGTSSDSEFTFATSLLPATRGTVAINYWDREYPTIQKEFKKQNYYVFSMHGNNCAFWNRNLFHKSYGYDKFYCNTEAYNIDETIGLGLSDKSFFKQSIPYLKEINKEHQNWYGLMIMLTNHTPFSYINEYSDLDITYKYKTTNPETNEIEEQTAPYLEGTVLGNYFKSVHYADEAIGQLLSDMDKEGLLENTVVIIYGDHDAKIKKSEYEYYYNYDFKTNKMLDKSDANYHEITEYEYELNRKVPLIIWEKNEQQKRQIETIGGMIDVAPTLANMFGLETKYALGNDLISVKDNIVILPDGNWITDKMYYNSQKEEALLLDKNYTISIDTIEKNNALAEQKISVSNSIIVYDIIKNLQKQENIIKGK